MNPGYAGRTELPESVKALFRPVVCITPDLEQICLISLFSDGFLEAKVLAKKMTVLYKLAQEQLSKQYHYDWGLRALTAVLRMAGVLRRNSPDLSEMLVMMRALRYSIYKISDGLLVAGVSNERPLRYLAQKDPKYSLIYCIIFKNCYTEFNIK